VDEIEGCVALDEAGVDEIEGCVALDEAGVDEVEGCEDPANGEGVQDIANGSRLHKKLRANISMERYFWRLVAGPLKITG
jgi:hypothetical protein